jgi:DNA mismatch repair protein MutS
MNIYIQNTKEIFDICKNAGITKLETFIEKEDVIFEDFEKIHQLLNRNVFTQNPSLFSHKGKILVAFQEFRKIKNLLHSCFQYVSYIDSILSISHLLNTSTDSHPYSFVDFYENKTKPAISIEKIWHPYLISSISPHTVQNDIQLKNNILITGPNAAGKSTFIKSVIVNILLAQTCCIASAQHFKFTPFHLIETYLHIPDSKGNQSLFEAEMYRSRDYLDRLKELEGKSFSFIVLDEIFSSTNFIEGFSGAYAILKKISSFQNTLSMTTTHYSDLEILEQDTNGRFENYHFEVTHDNQQNILFNYKIKRGTSRQYIALELLRKNGFDNDLIETAIEMSKNIEIRNKKYGHSKKKSTKKKNTRNKHTQKKKKITTEN